MQQYELTIGEDGGLELPIEIRRALGVENGGWVTLREVGDGIEITAASRSEVASEEDTTT